MHLVLALLRLLNPLKGKVIQHLTVIATVSVPSVASADGYCYPKVREVIRYKDVLRVKDVVEYVRIPVYTSSYAAISYVSNYSTLLANEKLVYQPYALPVQPVYAAPVYAQPLYAQPPALVQKQHAGSCEEKVAGLLARIEKLESGIPERLPLTANGGGIFVRKCASCHDDSDNAAKGKGHVFFRGGKPDEWDAVTLGEFSKQIRKGLMPKGGTMTTAEVDEAYNEIELRLKTPRQSLQSPASNGSSPLPPPTDPLPDPPANGNGKNNGQGR